MNRFTEIVPLVLTPLTPIHIGCGEDFEPTNYVIDGGILYGFEPSRLGLTSEDRQRLIECAGRPADAAVRAVQEFFHERRNQCRNVSHLALPVAAGVAQRYERRIGQVAQRERRGRTVTNRLEIERTAHHPYSGRPYLPGSSLKGSVRTGWLNEVDQVPPGPRNPTHRPAENANMLEQQILDGSFVTDPFRLVDLADATGTNLKSRVVFAINRRKRPRGDAQEQTLPVCREVIAGGQFRAATGEIRFKIRLASADPKHAPRAEKCIGDFAALARACNRFYRSRLEADLEVLAALGEVQWTGALQSLITTLQPALDDGRTMLLRVGRHSGAESVTLEHHRWIRIIGKRGTDPHWAHDATTIWLAAEREDSTTDLRPFGWLLLERPDSLSTNDTLSRWCDAELNAPRTQSAPRGSATRTSSTDDPKQPARSPLRRGANVIYQGETAIIREIDGAEARIEFDGGDTEWVPLDKLTLS